MIKQKRIQGILSERRKSFCKHSRLDKVVSKAPIWPVSFLFVDDIDIKNFKCPRTKFANEIIIIVSIKFSIPDPTTITTKTAEVAAAPTLRRTARSITMQFSRLTSPAPEQPRRTSTRFSRLTSPAHGRRRQT